MTWIQRLFTRKSVEFKPTFPIPPCNGKQWVIPDIHGCYQTFLTLLEQLALSKSDQLFLLGDLVDKGPSSAQVLDQIITMQKSGYQIFALRGNHEQMILDCAEEEAYKLSFMLEKFGATDLLKRKNKVKAQYLDFFKSLPYFFELKHHFLVHAGFDFKKSQPFQNYDQMMWMRNFKSDLTMTKGKTVIHGHVPSNIYVIEHAINTRQQVIPLDNGCVYWKKREGYGELLALELNSWELKKQECQDFTMLFGSRMAKI